jgi:3-oxoadipate enol-lactonase
MTVSHMIASPVGDLHAAVSGAGAAVIFWPSLFIDGEMWCDQVAGLEQHFQCIVLDPPGQGRSQRLARRVSLDECGDALIAVMQHFGLEEAQIVGCSWGGMVAINVAARFPDRVVSAVIANSSARAPALYDRIQVAFLAPILNVFGFIAPIRATIIRGFFSAGAPRKRPELGARIKAALARQTPSSIVYTAKSILAGRAGQTAMLAQISCPVLVLGGERDSIFPPIHSQEISAGIRGAELVLLNGIGHLAPIEAAGALTDHLKRFLSAGKA